VTRRVTDEVDEDPLQFDSSHEDDKHLIQYLPSLDSIEPQVV